MLDHLWLSVSVCLAWIVQLSVGRTLRPIRNTPPELLNELQLGKRSINSVFDLQSHEEFLWGDEGKLKRFMYTSQHWFYSTRFALVGIANAHTSPSIMQMSPWEGCRYI